MLDRVWMTCRRRRTSEDVVVVGGGVRVGRGRVGGSVACFWRTEVGEGGTSSSAWLSLGAVSTRTTGAVEAFHGWVVRGGCRCGSFWWTAGGKELRKPKRREHERREESERRRRKRRLTREGLGTLAVVTLDSLLLRRTPDGASPDPPCPTGVEVEAAEFGAGPRPCETRPKG